jgi:hypothetical protein
MRDRTTRISLWIECRCIAAFVALYVGTPPPGARANTEVTFITVKRGGPLRDGSNAAIERIGPNWFVVTMASTSAESSGGALRF